MCYYADRKIMGLKLNLECKFYAFAYIREGTRAIWQLNWFTSKIKIEICLLLFIIYVTTLSWAHLTAETVV